MLDLGIVFLILWMLKNAAMDVTHAVKGTPNPRYELKRQKAKAAGQAAPAQPRYGTKDWFSDLLSDGLAAQTERRRQKALERKTGAEKPLDDLADAVREEKPSLADRTPKQAELATMECHGCGRHVQVDDLHDGPGIKKQLLCGDCLHRATKPRIVVVDVPVDASPVAPVIPLFPIYKEEINVPNVNGEVTGLDPAISYSKALAQFAGEHGQAGNEGYLGFLTGSKVSGRGLQTAAEMQEAFSNAQAAAERHAKALESHKTVQEAYDVVPDAGDKAYLQGGR